jgi:hypothetical protein
LSNKFKLFRISKNKINTQKKKKKKRKKERKKERKKKKKKKTKKIKIENQRYIFCSFVIILKEAQTTKKVYNPR